MKTKIASIEGLRGIACLGIMLSHFVGAFYDWENMWFWDTPLSIMFTGETFVRLFFTLSGFVIGYKFFSKKKNNNIPLNTFNRYIRLIPMIFLATLSTYLLMKFNLLFNQEAALISGSIDFLGSFNNFSPEFFDCIKDIFVDTFTKSGNIYVGPFWTIPYELFGVVIVLCAVSLFKNTKARYIFYAIALVFINSYYVYFILGMMISDIYSFEKTAPLSVFFTA